MAESSPELQTVHPLCARALAPLGSAKKVTELHRSHAQGGDEDDHRHCESHEPARGTPTPTGIREIAPVNTANGGQTIRLRAAFLFRQKYAVDNAPSTIQMPKNSGKT